MAASSMRSISFWLTGSSVKERMLRRVLIASNKSMPTPLRLWPPFFIMSPLQTACPFSYAGHAVRVRTCTGGTNAF